MQKMSLLPENGDTWKEVSESFVWQTQHTKHMRCHARESIWIASVGNTRLLQETQSVVILIDLAAFFFFFIMLPNGVGGRQKEEEEEKKRKKR